MIKELEDAAKYERYINTAFHNSAKEKIPIPQEEISREVDDLRLQVNLAKNNLKEITNNSPALINAIVEELKIEEGDLTEFNKYFTTFKKVISNKKLKDLKQFRDDWALFKDQDLGFALTKKFEIPVMVESKDIKGWKKYNKEMLQKTSTEELDNLFREAVEFNEKKSIDDVEYIKYKTSQNNLSKPYKLINKDTIITFDPPLTGSPKMSKEEKDNNVKIRYILHTAEPLSSTRNLKIQWIGDKDKGKAIGSGILKKRLTNTRYH